ncbi:MAG: uroporphyrinogen-III synthase [Planctomycetaceae bacterium]|jgi:uroporphyrinogen III methyltransferase/synthase|nr:uroporphyrinogen-III synthase [Planctomycetaceae bacterium]
MSSILLTRPKHLVQPLRAELESLGWTVWLQPTIEIRPPDSWVEIDNVIRQLLFNHNENRFDWLVFSSVNGIQFFFDREQLLKEETKESDQTPCAIVDNQRTFLKSVRIAVIGTETNAALQQRIGRQADIVPEMFSIEGVLEYLLPDASAGKHFLLLRANRGRDLLRRRLEEAGGIVTEIIAYQSVDVEQPSPEIVELLRLGQIRYITVTSSAIACSLVRMFGDHLKQSELISISPITSNTLCDLGFPPQHEAKIASIKGIVDLLKTLSLTEQISISDLNCYDKILGRQHQ